MSNVGLIIIKTHLINLVEKKTAFVDLKKNKFMIFLIFFKYYK